VERCTDKRRKGEAYLTGGTAESSSKIFYCTKAVAYGICA